MGRDHSKLKELILYISEQCQYRLNYGATMLNKILFYSDFTAYAKYKEAITGEEYFKLRWGPAPKYLLEARDELEKEKAIVVRKRATMRGEQERIVPIGREANLSVFSPDQIAIVDAMIEALKDEDAKSVSGLSHQFYGWQIAKDREVIPYASVFLKEPIESPVPEPIREAIDRLKQQDESG